METGTRSLLEDDGGLLEDRFRVLGVSQSTMV
jgi:hypothetical protein